MLCVDWLNCLLQSSSATEKQQVCERIEIIKKGTEGLLRKDVAISVLLR